MSDPFVAEIRIFAGNFAPTGWASCDGQLIPISQNTALFSLLGTMYGGDGKSTFALPNLSGRAPMFWGQSQGLSLYDQGQEGGSPSVTLLQTEMPAHNHQVMTANAAGDINTPANLSLARSTGGSIYAATGVAAASAMAFNMVAPTGGGLPHNNMQPYLALYFIIAMQGVFPPRS
jgi:microcystin-dependent protein